LNKQASRRACFLWLAFFARAKKVTRAGDGVEKTTAFKIIKLFVREAHIYPPHPDLLPQGEGTLIKNKKPGNAGLSQTTIATVTPELAAAPLNNSLYAAQTPAGI
jgi:hypothetical protein